MNFDIDAYWFFLPFHLLATLFYFVIGRAMQSGIGRGSIQRRIQGRYVFWCMITGFFLGGIFSPLSGATTSAGRAGFAGFCLLIGWVIGMVAGAVATYRVEAKRNEGR